MFAAPSKRPQHIVSPNETKRAKTTDENVDIVIKQENGTKELELLEELPQPNREHGSAKGKYLRYNKEDLFAAAQAVRLKQMSYSKAAKFYNVPQASIQNCLKKDEIERRKSLVDSTLKPGEELQLLNWLMEGSELGDPKLSTEIGQAAIHILSQNDRLGVFEYGIPTRQWVDNFRNRHKKNIKVRNPDEKIDEGLFTRNFHAFLDKKNCLRVLERPDAFYFIEDVNFELDIQDFSPERRVNLKNALLNKWVSANTSVFRPGRSVTVNYCFGANGRVLQQLLIFRESYNDMIKVALADKQLNSNFLFTRTEDGGNTQDSMRGFLERIDAQLADVERPIFIFFHATLPCIGIETTSWCREKQIYVISFIPNNTSILNNIDELIFGVKNCGWITEMKNFQKQYNLTTFSEVDFVCVLKSMNDRIISEDKIIVSFAEAGVYPFDKEKIGDDVPRGEVQVEETTKEIGTYRTIKKSIMDLIRSISKTNQELSQVLIEDEEVDDLQLCVKVIEQQLNIIKSKC